MGRHPQVYLDVAVGSNLSGRIVIEFFNNSSELLIENFIKLCSSSNLSQNSGRSVPNSSKLGPGWTLIKGRPKLLTYKNCTVFKVIKGEYMECGDVVNNDGTGYKFDYSFKDYPNTRSHSQAGLVTVVNYRGYSGGTTSTTERKELYTEFTTNTFGSQFCILFGSARSLDGRYSVIGRVVSGMEFVRAIENVPVYPNNTPRMEVLVMGCGSLDPVETKLVSKEVDEQRKLLEGLMASATGTTSKSSSASSYGLTVGDQGTGDSSYEEVRCVYSGRIKNKRKPDPESSNTLGKRLLAEAIQGIKHHYVPSTGGSYTDKDKGDTIRVVDEDRSSYLPDKYNDSSTPCASDKEGMDDRVLDGDHKAEGMDKPVEDVQDTSVDEDDLDPITRRLMKLSGKIDECSRLNKNEVILEDKIKANPRLARSFNTTLKSPTNTGFTQTQGPPSPGDTTLEDANKEGNEEVVNIRFTNELNMPASVVERMNKIERTKSKNKTFGWNVFNQDALYRAHKKRLKETGFNHKLYEKQKQQLGESFYEPTIVNHEPSETNKDLIVKNVEKQYKKRDQFSRRRLYDDDAKDISYINERNRVFNKKLERSFGAYSEEIKRNLERGTAL